MKEKDALREARKKGCSEAKARQVRAKNNRITHQKAGDIT